MIGALRRGRLLGILMDQDTGVEGVFVDFLGRKAHTPVGPAALGLATGAPIVPMAIHWEAGHRHVIEICEPLWPQPSGDRERDLKEISLRLNRELGRFILAHPEQWVWMHDRWRRKPDETGT
jgi:KDO2-lipid IV(A) lauroyltransferase